VTALINLWPSSEKGLNFICYSLNKAFIIIILFNSTLGHAMTKMHSSYSTYYHDLAERTLLLAERVIGLLMWINLFSLWASSVRTMALLPGSVAITMTTMRTGNYWSFVLLYSGGFRILFKFPFFFLPRRFKFRCCIGQHFSPRDCTTGSGFVNDWREPIIFKTPLEYFLVGVTSYYDNYQE
jgi:hypothetical protein